MCFFWFLLIFIVWSDEQYLSIKRECRICWCNTWMRSTCQCAFYLRTFEACSLIWSGCSVDISHFIWYSKHLKHIKLKVVYSIYTLGWSWFQVYVDLYITIREHNLLRWTYSSITSTTMPQTPLSVSAKSAIHAAWRHITIPPQTHGYNTWTLPFL